jgi:hypothetical protein
MAFRDDRWSTEFSCEPMFVESAMEQERIESIEDYAENSEYSKNKLLACYPSWWNNTDVGCDRKAEYDLMCQQFLDPSFQQLSSVFRVMKTKIQMVRFNASIDGKGAISTMWWDRCRRDLVGMPILNPVSVGSPVTKLPKPVGTNSLLEEFNFFNGKFSRSMSYSYEDRFVSPILPLVVHYFYEVIHGPDYIHTHKGERLRDSLLCLGNLKAFCSSQKPVVDKLVMDYIFSNKTFPSDMEMLKIETAGEAFNYEGAMVRDKMMNSPSDVGSVVRFFTNAMIVANVTTSKEVKDPKRSVSTPLFATKIGILFETLEDKTSTHHRENIALYGM